MISVFAVKSEKLPSRLIRWGLEEDASHLLIVMNNVIWHSSIHGVEVLPAERLQDFEIVSSVHLPNEKGDQKKLDVALAAIIDHGYDWKAVAYFAWRVALRKFFKKPLPTRGPQDPGRYLCIEVLYSFLEGYCVITGRTIVLPERILSLMSPMECVDWIGRSFSLPVIRSVYE